MNILAGEVFSPGLEKARVVGRRWGGEDGMGWNGAGGASHGLRGGAVVVMVVVVGAERRGWGGGGGGKRVGVGVRVVKPFRLDLSKKRIAIFLS